MRWRGRSLPTLFALAGLLLACAPPGSAAPMVQGAQQVKEVALARARASGATPTPVRVDIARVIGNWALVRLYPRPGQTDPALVIVQRKGGVWNAVAGPGTAFPPDLSLPEQWPAELFGGSGLYGGTTIFPEQVSPGAVRHWIAEGTNVAFRFPFEASARLEGGRIVIAGPAAAPYQIVLAPLAENVGPALDEWAFDRMQAQPNPASLSAEYFPAATTNIFLIEAAQGATLTREYLVAPKRGGTAWSVQATIARPQPERTSLPPAELALSLILQTLLIGPGATIRPQALYLDPITGYQVQYPELWTALFADGAGVGLNAPGRITPASRSVTIAAVAAATLAEAERQVIESFGRNVRTVGTSTFGPLVARRYQGQDPQSAAPVWGYLIQLAPDRVLSAVVKNDSAGPDGNPVNGFPIVASIARLP
ncbi:MAG: hypothetical protein KatS3mg061_2366 [Dehalococcoidia bacterium]|nr:MAG: hypothetical protein KatS3mg061_2366 [Dehalococcoidia bacterium]